MLTIKPKQTFSVIVLSQSLCKLVKNRQKKYSFDNLFTKDKSVLLFK